MFGKKKCVARANRPRKLSTRTKGEEEYALCVRAVETFMEDHRINNAVFVFDNSDRKNTENCRVCSGQKGCPPTEFRTASCLVYSGKVGHGKNVPARAGHFENSNRHRDRESENQPRPRPPKCLRLSVFRDRDSVPALVPAREGGGRRMEWVCNRHNPNENWVFS